MGLLEGALKYTRPYTMEYTRAYAMENNIVSLVFPIKLDMQEQKLNSLSLFFFIQIDERILRLLKTYGLDVEQARKSIENNKHNHLSTSYYLLNQKYKSNPGLY